MTITEAVNLLDSTVAQIGLSREGHVNLVEAMKTITTALAVKKEEVVEIEKEK